LFDAMSDDHANDDGLWLWIPGPRLRRVPA